MDDEDYGAGLDPDLPDHARQHIINLNRRIWQQAWTNIQMEASIHDDWDDINTALSDKESVGYKYFRIGLWAGTSATTMTYINEGILRPD